MSAADDLAAVWLTAHRTFIRRYVGSSAVGVVYDPPVGSDPTPLAGFVDDANKLILAADGTQTVSSARVFYPAATPAIPLDSLVTLGAPFLDRTSRVIAVSVHDGGTADTPNHVVVALL